MSDLMEENCFYMAFIGVRLGSEEPELHDKRNRD